MGFFVRENKETEWSGSFRYILFHAFCVISLELSFFSTIYKVSINLGMRFTEASASSSPITINEVAKASAVIQSSAITVADRMLMLHRIARSRINGMGIFLSVFVIEVAVVSGSSHTEIGLL